MPEFARDEITQHYEIEGDGPPLLLLAGMLSDSASWGPLPPQFTDRYTVIRPDNRTTGRTVPWDAPTDCQRMTDDALALMTHLGFERFHVAGHSMGGLLTLEIAGQAPERVATATVMASGRFRTPRTTAVFDALLKLRRAPQGEEMWLRALYPWVFGNAFFEDPENTELALAAATSYPHQQTVDAMAHQVAMFSQFRPKAKLDQITCPTLVLYAGQDVLVPPAMARPSFDPLPNAQHETIEDAGHSIVWDAPQEVGRLLGAFLAEHPLG